jgi:CheY-like chemotaxis protein
LTLDGEDCKLAGGRSDIPRDVPSQRILIVDDFEDFRRFIYSTLQQRPGFRVIGEAADGLEALEKARELQPDLILLDIGLPHLNGMEVARRVRKAAPATKILFLSVESDPDLAQEALRLGAGYVHKPRAQIDLLSAIEAVLSGGQFVSPGLEISGGTDDDPQRHEVQIYSADLVFLESFGHFLGTALKSDNPAIVLATKLHRKSLVEKLKQEGLDIDSAIRQGTYISLDAAGMLSTIMVDGVPDRVRFSQGLQGLIASAGKAAKKAHSRAAICGECVGLLCAEGNTNAAIELEKAGNDLIQMHNVDILCGYPLSGFHRGDDDPAFATICGLHTAAYFR